MSIEEIVAKAKELASLDSLAGRSGEVALLKKEAKRLEHMDDVSFKEQELIEEFNVYYAKLASQESSLLASAYDDKKALVEKAKALVNGPDFRKATEEMNNLFDQFKACGRCSKEQDDELWSEFKAIKDEFYANKKAHYEEVVKKMAEAKAAKEKIIEEAKVALDAPTFKEGLQKMNALMDEWKKAGFASKEDNEALWAAFSEVRKAFFDKKKEYDEKMKATYAERVSKKQDIIKRAQILLANSTFTKEEVEKMKALRDEWKQVGFAGKESDDALWNEFQGKMNKYFEEMRSYKE